MYLWKIIRMSLVWHILATKGVQNTVWFGMNANQGMITLTKTYGIYIQSSTPEIGAGHRIWKRVQNDAQLSHNKLNKNVNHPKDYYVWNLVWPLDYNKPSTDNAEDSSVKNLGTSPGYLKMNYLPVDKALVVICCKSLHYFTVAMKLNTVCRPLT